MNRFCISSSRIIFGVLLVLLSLPGLVFGQDPFEDVTVEAGVDIPLARRAAWADFDNDERLDVMIGRHLYRNNGDGTFSDLIDEVIVRGPGAWGDFDNDGNLDFYRPQFGGFGVLYRNEGDGTFSVVTVPGNLHLQGWAAAWADADRDGHLDFYVTNFENSSLVHEPDYFFRNDGDGTFTREWEAPSSPGRGVNWADFDNDGDQDIHVSNYRLRKNFLWVNDGFGNFDEQGEDRGIAGHGHTIGSSWGDLNNDGYMDLVSVNLSHSPLTQDIVMVLMNSGPPDFTFTNINEFVAFGQPAAAGILYQEGQAKGALADYDNDGVLDLAMSDVAIFDSASVYRGLGDGTFEFAQNLGGADSYAVAWGDYDGDGFMDLINAQALWRNKGNSNNWVKVRPIGDGGSNRAAIGARVKITAGGQSQIREIEGGSSENQNEPIAHFGLGAFSGMVEVEVRFPSSRVGTWFVLPGETLEARESDAAWGTVKNSEIIAHDFPESLGPGQTYDASITVTNTGDTVWPTSYGLGTAQEFWLSGPVYPASPIFPGATYEFTIPLIAPAWSGDIWGYWQMFFDPGGPASLMGRSSSQDQFRPIVGDGRVFFGDGLLTMVSVFPGGGIDDSSVLSSQGLNLVLPGQEFEVSFTLVNTGTTTWTEGTGYDLRASFDTDPFTTQTTLELGSEVPPGASYSVTIPMLAPQREDIYISEWQMTRDTVRFGARVQMRIRVIAPP